MADNKETIFVSSTLMGRKSIKGYRNYYKICLILRIHSNLDNQSIGKHMDYFIILRLLKNQWI
jgi:hypothetical protein